MSLKYAVTYKVTGAGSFPFDMLRYDRSSPYREIPDSGMLDGDNRDSGWYIHPRTVQLITYVESAAVVKKGFCPCKERWESFGWSVSEITVQKLS